MGRGIDQERDSTGLGQFERIQVRKGRRSVQRLLTIPLARDRQRQRRRFARRQWDTAIREICEVDARHHAATLARIIPASSSTNSTATGRCQFWPAAASGTAPPAGARVVTSAALAAGSWTVKK